MKNKIPNEENRVSYMEGEWAAGSINQYIEKTVYKTLDEAIKQKTILIEKFESDFGYSPDMMDVDTNYFFNLGIRDGLQKLVKENE